MASKPLLPFHFIVNQSMPGSFSSQPIYIQYQDNFSIQINWSGNPVGMFTVSVSNDYNPNTELGTFINIPLVPAITANGIPDSAFLEGNQLVGTWIKLNYTATSGNGNINGYTTAKGI